MTWVPQRTWVRVLVAVLLLLGLAAYVIPHMLYPTQPIPGQTAMRMKAQAALQGPAKIYAATCAHCHAPHEGALIGPDLHGRGLAPEAVKVIVRNGVRSMPAFLPSKISDAELAGLATFVNQLPARAGEGARP